ncbi:hypothetical protein KAOT1_18797 [Kordia algicida OT-1]|uniref:Uncharacterized protein n=2 Tax=Kordia TaxID=221065 RepID=A9DNP2_9FLAO|nr:hypothetical protein KAOT1_18797 [Kordia algicida OT-1]
MEGEIGVWEDIYNQRVNSEVLIYGSSRAYVHINPMQIQDSLNVRCYNFGVNGQNFRIQYLRHLEYMEHNPKPKTIIVSVDIFSLQKVANLYNYRQFLPYLHKENVQKYTSAYNGFNTFDYYLPLVKYYGEHDAIKRAFAKFNEKTPHQQFRIRGYHPVDRDWNTDFSKAKTKKSSYVIEVDAEIQQLFENFLADCQEKNIQVVMVYTPIYKIGQQYVENHDDITAYFEKLSTDFKIPFFNYLEDDICLAQRYFYNSTHLNKKGSIVFTNMLIRDLKKNHISLD